MKRLPKKEYFEMRLAQAIDLGLTKKADYYRTRLKVLASPRVPVNRNHLQMAQLIERLKPKFAVMTEAEQLIEANKFYRAMDGKVNMSDCMSLMSQVIGGTLAAHAFQI